MSGFSTQTRKHSVTVSLTFRPVQEEKIKIYLAIKKMLTKRGIEPKQVVSLTTDGAPAMIGREKGAVARLKEDNPELIAYHCIIHQSVICASLSDEHAEVMNTMMKMINFLRVSSSYHHRILREFLREVDAPSVMGIGVC